MLNCHHLEKQWLLHFSKENIQLIFKKQLWKMTKKKKKTEYFKYTHGLSQSPFKTCLWINKKKKKEKKEELWFLLGLQIKVTSRKEGAELVIATQHTLTPIKMRYHKDSNEQNLAPLIFLSRRHKYKIELFPCVKLKGTSVY